MGVFTPWKLARATNSVSFLFSGEALVNHCQHTIWYTGVLMSGCWGFGVLLMAPWETCEQITSLSGLFPHPPPFVSLYVSVGLEYFIMQPKAKKIFHHFQFFKKIKHCNRKDYNDI